MTVSEVKDGLHMAPDHVYVIAPNNYLTVDGDTLRLMNRTNRVAIAIRSTCCSSRLPSSARNAPPLSSSREGEQRHTKV